MSSSSQDLSHWDLNVPKHLEFGLLYTNQNVLLTAENDEYSNISKGTYLLFLKCETFPNNPMTMYLSFFDLTRQNVCRIPLVKSTDHLGRPCNNYVFFKLVSKYDQ